MSDASEAPAPQSNAAPLLALFGAVLLFVSPFLTWFADVGTGWKIFEFVDVAIIALAGYVVVLCTSRLLAVSGAPHRTRLLAAGAVSALLVLATVTEPPPAALEADAAFGAWLALVSSLIILAAGALDLARLSINVSVSAQRQPEAPAPVTPTPPAPSVSDDAPTAVAVPPVPREPALFRPEQPTPPVVPEADPNR